MRLGVGRGTWGQRAGRASEQVGPPQNGPSPCGEAAAHCRFRRGRGPAGAGLHPRGGRKFPLLEAGALSFASVPRFSPGFSSCHRLASFFTTQDRGDERGDGNQGETLAFFRPRRVFQRTTGRHHEERRSKACVILTVVLRGKRTPTGSVAPEPHAGRSDTPPPLPRGRRGLAVTEATGARVISCGGGSWVKTIGGEKPLWCSSRRDVTCLRVPAAPTEDADSTGPKQQELGRPGRKQRGKARREARPRRPRPTSLLEGPDV